MILSEKRKTDDSPFWTSSRKRFGATEESTCLNDRVVQRGSAYALPALRKRRDGSSSSEVRFLRRLSQDFRPRTHASDVETYLVFLNRDRNTLVFQRFFYRRRREGGEPRLRYSNGDGPGPSPCQLPRAAISDRRSQENWAGCAIHQSYNSPADSAEKAFWGCRNCKKFSECFFYGQPVS